MRGLLFLLNALFLLESTKAKGMIYDKLNDGDRKIVDKAIEQANQNYGNGKHLDFFTIVNKNNNMVNVVLRPTSCDSTTPIVHRKECSLLNKPPQVSCIDCKGTMERCLLLKQTEEIKKRMEKCSPSVNIHRTGFAHAMYQKSGNEQQQIGCLGCI
ncbi:cystatin-like protein [Sinocyclocheilus rhinocerous]|uniref:Cystatin-like protein n=1 Tax=Sinocyclocheilus rhinocerous TaxID=307959 RepID=A0A673NE78_9TELE|nr:PREDICTED: cystatin-like protein [Sinocyclocheilus rhinocerous]